MEGYVALRTKLVQFSVNLIPNLLYSVLMCRGYKTFIGRTNWFDIDD